MSHGITGWQPRAGALAHHVSRGRVYLSTVIIAIALIAAAIFASVQKSRQHARNIQQLVESRGAWIRMSQRISLARPAVGRRRRKNRARLGAMKLGRKVFDGQAA